MLTRLFSWYFSKRALPHWGILMLDLSIVAFSVLVAQSFELEGLEWLHYTEAIAGGLLVTVMLFTVSFRLFHVYSGIVRYSTFVDLQRVGTANLLGSFLTLLAAMLVQQTEAVRLPVPEGVGIIFVVATLLMWVERIFVKRMFDLFRMDQAVPVAIYGTKAGGVSLAKSLASMKETEYKLVAFIGDEPDLKDTYLMGKKVWLNGKGIAEQMKLLGVELLLVSPLKNDPFRENIAMVDEFIAAGIHIKMMPMAQEWDGKTDLKASHLHEVEIEDLLPREKIEVDMEAIGALLQGKRILITGAAGSIGSELVRQVACFQPAEMILIDQAETPMHDVRLMMAREYAQIPNQTIVSSIANQPHMEKIFAKHRPDYVFHAAAYKHVPMMEDNPAIAVQNNIYGTRVIADLAVKYDTKKFVMISTDKAVNPTNVMGCSKRICEIYCQSLNEALVKGVVKGSTQFVTTRFGNVLGSNGSVIPIFREQIRKGEPVTVTHPDIIRYFMLIPEACRLVLEAGTMGQGGEIFVFDMGQPVRIVDLAERMIKLSGSSVGIRFSGLRPGEKLYEELLSTQENTKPTVHPKIMVAQVREYDYETACRNEQRLLEASGSFDNMAIVKIMKEIVPEYKSQHSVYEVLD